MREKITVQLNLSVPTRTLIFFMAAMLLFTVTPELGSENVTLSTYYPAPSGVYNQMITTGNTYLATTGGNVGIGTTNPQAALYVGAGNLDVAGGIIHVAGNTSPTTTTQGAYIGWNALTGGTGETDFINNQGGGSGGFAFMNTPASGNPRTNIMTITGSGNVGLQTATPSASFHVANGNALIGTSNSGGITPNTKPYLYIDATNSACSQIACAVDPSGDNPGACTCGGYITWTPGLYIEGYTYNNLGYPAYVDISGVSSTQVQALNSTTGVSGWGTLMISPAAGGTVWCCPK
jgi:hypothetical protein